jgi:hypothetical protein
VRAAAGTRPLPAGRRENAAAAEINGGGALLRLPAHVCPFTTYRRAADKESEAHGEAEHFRSRFFMEVHFMDEGWGLWALLSFDGDCIRRLAIRMSRAPSWTDFGCALQGEISM